MPACSVCSREDAGVVDDKLAAGVPFKKICEEHPPLKPMALSRHRTNHLAPGLALMQQKVNGGKGNQARLEDLYEKAEGILDRAEGEQDGRLSILAIAELRKTVELLAKLTGELDERPTVQVLNLHASQEWLDLRSKLFMALAPFPQARVAVAGALGGQEAISP